MLGTLHFDTGMCTLLNAEHGGPLLIRDGDAQPLPRNFPRLPLHRLPHPNPDPDPF
jgi:hypothetical protein